MSRHIERKHPECVPDAVRAKKCDQVGHEPIDADATRDFVHDVVLRDLFPFRASSSPGMKQFLRKHCKTGIGQKTMVSGLVDDIFVKGEGEVFRRVAEAREQKCRMSLSADTWKSKGATRTHYLALIVRWVSPDWNLNEMCLGVVEMRGSKTHADYSKCFRAVLDAASLHLDDIVAFVSDHEGAIRKSARLLGLTCVGCGCHALQLPIKHVLPPLRPQVAKPVEPVESVSDDGSSSQSGASDTSDSSTVCEDVASPGAAVPRGKKRERDEEREAITEHLTPLFKKGRHLIKWYINHDTVYNELMDVAKGAGIPVQRFDRETATRWCSALNSQASLLYNDAALSTLAANRGGLPQKYNNDECRMARDVAGVFTPLAVGTRVLERDTEESQASHYLPMWYGVQQALVASNPKIPKPAGAGPWGSDVPGAKYLSGDSVHPVANRLRAWLHKDVGKTFEKHNAGQPSERVLRVASFLDPRHKHLSFLNEEQKKDTLHQVAVMAVALAEKDPALSEQIEADAAAKRHEQALADARASHPDEQPLCTTRKWTLKDAKKLSKPRLQEELGARKMDITGLRETLIERLTSAAPPVVAKPLPPAPVVEEKAFGENDLLAASLPDTVPGQQLVSVLQRIKNQIKNYQAQARLEKGSPLKWWKEKAHLFPFLAPLARDLLGIPGSSAALERSFSHAKRAVNPTRPRLHPKRACKIIFCHENIIRSIF